MAVGDIFRLAHVGGYLGQSLVNVHHYRQTTANSSGMGEPESLARAFNLSIVPALALLLTDHVSWGAIEARTFNAPGVPITGYDLTLSSTGAIDNVGCPPTVAIVVRKKTGFLGRKYRGRSFFAGMPIADIDSGKIAPGKIADWQDFADTLATPITWSLGGSPTFTPVIAALDGSVIVAPVGVRWNTVTSCLVDDILRSQRRREIGVGS